MIDQLIIGNVASYDIYGASMKERKIHEPAKKIIKNTVPFSNVTYDFSAINGEVYWEERVLEYVFEILADSPEELEEKKIRFKSWIMNVMNEEIHDPYILDYYFIGTFESIDADDSEIEKSTIVVTFTAYPYMLSNDKTTYTVNLTAGKKAEVNVVNNSSHRISPTITNNVSITLEIDGNSYSVNAGSREYEKIKLETGTTKISATSSSNGTLTIEFYEEVL